MIKSGENMKAQASIEYLSTFMWTALAILALVGVISYFGIFNLEQYQETGCETGEQLPCLDIMANPSGRVTVMVRNDLSADIEIAGGELQSSQSEQSIILEEIDEYLETGITIEAVFDTQEQLELGAIEEYEVCISYRTEYDGREYVVCGDAVVEVQPPQEGPECRNNIHEDSLGEMCDVVDGVDVGCAASRYCAPNCQCLVDDGGDAKFESQSQTI